MNSVCNRLLSAAGALLLAFTPSFAQAETRKLREVHMPLQPDEIVVGQNVLGSVNGKLVLDVSTAKAATPTVLSRELVVSAAGESTELLLDATDYVDDYNDSGGKLFAEITATSNGDSLLINASEPWSDHYFTTDGTAAGTQHVSDESLGAPAFSYNDKVAAFVGSKVVLQRQEGPYSSFYFVSSLDLQTGVSERIITHNNGPLEAQKVPGTDDILLRGQDDQGVTLWRTDGTAVGTTLLKRTPAPSGFNPYGGAWIFRPSDGNDGASMRSFYTFPFASDGTVAGTVVIDTQLLSGSCTPIANAGGAFQLGDQAIFSRCLGGATEIAALDLRTSTITTLKSFAGYSSLHLTPNGNWRMYLGHLLFFAPQRADGGFELWRTNGTADGTFKIAELGGPSEDQRRNPLLEISSIFVAGGSLYFNNIDGAVWVSDGTLEGTYATTPANFSYGAQYFGNSMTPFLGGAAMASVQDYLRSEILGTPTPTDPNQDEKIFALSLLLHDPSLAHSPTGVLLGVPRFSDQKLITTLLLQRVAASGSFLYVSVKTTKIAPLPSGGMTTVNYDQRLLVVETDLCDDDNNKFLPGVCGCGIEEQQLALLDTAPLGAACLTTEGTALINPEAARAPKVIRQKQVGAMTEMALAFDDNVLEHVSAGIDMAQGGTAAAGSNNSVLSGKVSIKHEVRLVRVRGKTTKAPIVRSQGRGIFLVRIPGAVRSGDKVLFEYGFKATSKATKATVLAATQLKRGIVKVRR